MTPWIFYIPVLSPQQIVSPPNLFISCCFPPSHNTILPNHHSLLSPLFCQGALLIYWFIGDFILILEWMKTLVLVRHGESEYNASLQPERQEFSLKQVGPGGTFLHHPKLLGMQIIISFIIIYRRKCKLLVKRNCQDWY